MAFIGPQVGTSPQRDEAVAEVAHMHLIGDEGGSEGGGGDFVAGAKPLEYVCHSLDLLVIQGPPDEDSLEHVSVIVLFFSCYGCYVV